MSIDGINGDSIKSQIRSIAKSENAGSRSGRIEILKKVSELGKSLLDAINTKDETLVEMEGNYEELASEMKDLQNEIDGTQKKINEANNGVKNVDKRIAELQLKAEKDGDLSEEDRQELVELYRLRDSQVNGINVVNGQAKLLGNKLAGYTPKMEKYNEALGDILETMDDYADAGDEIRQAAHDYGRAQMAENLETPSGSNALKRNESAWGCDTGGLFDILTGGMVSGIRYLSDGGKNDTEEYVEKMGYRGLNDGGGGMNMTYHDDLSGGYQAEYDVMQYGIGGELRDLTAKTWSYGKTVNTAGNDMKRRAENLNNKQNESE